MYAGSGFDVLGDAVFRDLVVAGVVESTSLLGRCPGPDGPGQGTRQLSGRGTDHGPATLRDGEGRLGTAGLLAKRGLRVLVIERRDRVGGAAITETPWGPKYKMTSLSYVVSLLPPTVQRELELHRFGYKVYPQHGYFVPREDGRSLMLPDDPVRKYGEIAKFSKRDADAKRRANNTRTFLKRDPEVELSHSTRSEADKYQAAFHS